MAALLSLAPGCERTQEDVDRYRRDRNVSGLVKVLADRHASLGLRTQAARALGEVDDERALDPLCAAMLLDAENHPIPCELQRAAAEAMGQIGSPRAIPRLIEALRWEHVRWSAERALVKIGRPSVEPLIAALQDEDPPVREASVVALGEIGDSTAVAALIPLLTAPEKEIRAAVTRSLGLLKAPEAVRPLLAAKEKGLATFEYFEALGKIGGEAALQEILAAIGSARYASQPRQALAVIGEPAIPFVQRALATCAENERINYLAALGEMSCPKAAEAIKSFLSDADPGMRWQALWVLCENIARRPEAEARQARRTLLEEIGRSPSFEPEMAEWAIEQASSPDFTVHWALIERLLAGGLEGARVARFGRKNPSRSTIGNPVIEHGGPAEAPFLVLMMHDETPLSRQSFAGPAATTPSSSVPTSPCDEALEALERMGEAAVIPLTWALRQMEDFRAGQVADALGRLGDERAVNALLDCTRCGDKYAAQKATEALHRIQNGRASPQRNVPGKPAPEWNPGSEVDGHTIGQTID